MKAWQERHKVCTADFTAIFIVPPGDIKSAFCFAPNFRAARTTHGPLRARAFGQRDREKMKKKEEERRKG